ncbi:hypothetical protein CRG98_014264, partial [Punica granatum]
VDTPKPRDPKARNAGPDESPHSGPHTYATRLGSIHLPGDVRRTHVRRSRHLPFYDSKVEGRQVTRV